MNNLLSYCGLVDAKIRASDIVADRNFDQNSATVCKTQTRFEKKGLNIFQSEKADVNGSFEEIRKNSN